MYKFVIGVHLSIKLQKWHGVFNLQIRHAFEVSFDQYITNPSRPPEEPDCFGKSEQNLQQNLQHLCPTWFTCTLQFQGTNRFQLTHSYTFLLFLFSITFGYQKHVPFFFSKGTRRKIHQSRLIVILFIEMNVSIDSNRMCTALVNMLNVTYYLEKIKSISCSDSLSM